MESGLNDGLALPFVTIFMALTAEQLHGGGVSVAEVAMKSLVPSPALGVAIGGLGALALRRATTAGWAADGWVEVAVVAVVFAAYAATVDVGGSGFIGAWVAGFIAGRVGNRSVVNAPGSRRWSACSWRRPDSSGSASCSSDRNSPSSAGRRSGTPSSA